MESEPGLPDMVFSYTNPESWKGSCYKGFPWLPRLPRKESHSHK